MNEKEIAELRRRFKLDKNNINYVVGCYVNEKGEVISRFRQSLSILSEEKQEKILTLLRKSMSGGIGRNLTDIAFETRQVVKGEEHALLMKLRNSKLENEEALEDFYRKVIAGMNIEGSYLILLANDIYDVPFRSRDGARQDDAGSDLFSYIVCSVCPVKMTKPALSYSAHENEFVNLAADWVIAPPETGFLFPAFDDRSTNIYGALYYTKSAKDVHEAFLENVFQTQPPMAADTQMETFQTVLGESLGEDCSYDLVQGVHDKLCNMIAAHKDAREEEPLTVDKDTMKWVLQSCEVPDAAVERFDAQFEEAFGSDADLSPKNLIDTRRLEIKTPDVVIRISPDRSDLVQTRVIDGTRYILVRAEEDVTVEGVNITIGE